MQTNSIGATREYARLTDDVLRDMGETTQGWQIDWAKRFGVDARATLVCKLSHQFRAEKVLKVHLAPITPDVFDRILDNQATAHQALQGRLPGVVAEIHGVSHRHQALLMDYVGTQTFAEHLADSDADVAVFGTIGEALGCLAHETYEKDGRLGDLVMFEFMNRVIEDVYNGRRGIAFPRRFLTLADAFRDHLTRFGNEPVAIALRHGDLNTENIRISESGIHLIDFEGVGRGAVLDDIMHVFVHATLERAVRREDMSAKSSEHAALLAGFNSFEKRPVGRGVLHTLYLHRLVRAWFHLSRNGIDRLHQMRPKFQCLVDMADRAVAQS